MTTEYRGKVRARDRETSWEAASRQTNTKTAALQILIYNELLKYGPKTDEELLLKIGRLGPVSPSGIRTRRHELELAGWVVSAANPKTGELLKRNTMGGSPATVWRAVTADDPLPEPKAPEPPKTAPRPARAEPTHDHLAGLRAAERLAGWEIGEPSWAEQIVDAYLYPAATMKRLDEEGAP